MPIIDRIRYSIDEEIIAYTPGRMAKAGISIDSLIEQMGTVDLTIVYQQNSQFSKELEQKLTPLKDKYRIIAFANDPTLWGLTSVDHSVAVQAYEYMITGGDENFKHMFDYVAKSLLGKDGDPFPVEEVPWQGLVGIDNGAVYQSVDDYIASNNIDPSRPFVGIVGSRPVFLMDGLYLERQMARMFDKAGINTLLIFTTFSKNEDRGCLGIVENIDRYFCKDGEPIVDAVVKYSTGFMGSTKNAEEDPQYKGALSRMAELNIPFYQPVVLARMSESEWRDSIGLTTDITWQIAFPEFEGLIDPLVVGSDVGYSPTEEKKRVCFDERMERMVSRVANRIKLRHKPNSEKKVVIFLNNFPCYGVEANVGNAAGLDSLESIADLMKEMKRQGYSLEPPADGKDLITRILDSKALSEFRWTTAQEMVKCGGVLYAMPTSEYLGYYSTLSEKAQTDVRNTWGDPPGQGMVFNDNILITGVSFGNVIVAVQPKRGCFGSRCDGQVCKILHDPACPPTHQYLATYHYYSHVLGADAIIHTGTHGSMEWTPGKGVGMTESCYPDICMSDMPHLYIYNSDNPSEGLVAKRRSYATLIDHMQNLMVGVNLYGPYAELDQLLSERDTAKTNPSRSNELKKAILKKVNEAKLQDIGLTEDMPLDECIRLCHETLSRLRNSQMNKGLHILGRMPTGQDRVDGVFSIIRYGEENDSLRDCISDMKGYSLSELYRNQGDIDDRLGISNGAIIELIDGESRQFVSDTLEGLAPTEAAHKLGYQPDDTQASQLTKFAEIIHDIDSRMGQSDEIGSLMNGLDGGYTPSGPSGYITRGRYDILPTGRNFYSMDPHASPTKTAWAVGCKIAFETVEKYIAEEGRVPESIGFFWTMGELISTGGELMSQIMYLLGAQPKWGPDNRVIGFEIMPLETLGRPRIDVTINISCILRDNMMNAIDYMDEVITAVANLNEPVEMNYVRKHSLESISEGISEDDACARMFGAPPGTYTSGVNLAVFASAWEEDKDLADVFIRTKGHGYGGKRNGRPMYQEFSSVLARNDITYNQTVSDETDLLSCSCKFSNIGGMAVASRYLSGKDVKVYVGDTRDPRDLNIETLAEEIRRSMRTRTLNPEWIEGMKQHGYKGAMDIAKRVTRLFGWQATTHEVDDWLFDEVVELFVKDEEMRQFFNENNPYALEEMTRRLLEANSRGLWNTDEQTLSELQNVYLDSESMLEEKAGEGEFQGGSVDIYDASSTPEWGHGIDVVSEISRQRREKNIKP